MDENENLKQFLLTFYGEFAPDDAEMLTDERVKQIGQAYEYNYRNILDAVYSEFAPKEAPDFKRGSLILEAYGLPDAKRETGEGMVTNPLTSFGTKLGETVGFQLPAAGAATGAVALGNTKDIVRIAEGGSKEIYNALNTTDILATEARKEMEGISKMQNRYKNALDEGDISKEEYDSFINKTKGRVNFLNEKGFADGTPDDQLEKTQKAAVVWANERQQAGAEFSKDIIDTMDEAKDAVGWLNWTASAMGQAVGQIPLSFASFGTSSIAQEVGGIYIDQINRVAEEEGITPQEVIERGLDDRASSMAYGTAAGLLDRLSAGSVMGSFGKKEFRNSLAKRALKFFSTVTAPEAATEGIQTGLEQKGAGRETDWKEIKEASAQGAVGSTGLSGGGHVVQATRQAMGKGKTASTSDSEADTGYEQSSTVENDTEKISKNVTEVVADLEEDIDQVSNDVAPVSAEIAADIDSNGRFSDEDLAMFKDVVVEKGVEQEQENRIKEEQQKEAAEKKANVKFRKKEQPTKTVENEQSRKEQSDRKVDAKQEGKPETEQKVGETKTVKQVPIEVGKKEVESKITPVKETKVKATPVKKPTTSKDVTIAERSKRKAAKKNASQENQLYKESDITEVKDAAKFVQAQKEAISKRKEDKLQVDLMGEKDAKKIIDDGGKLFMTNDNKAGAYVKKDGYMGGLFKDPTSEKSQAAKSLQNVRTKAGGKFFDAFATHLEDIYIENGFRPVARMKFDENFAPKGWEKTNLKTKPDNVFFVYDPQYKAKKGEGDVITDYDLGYELAKNFKSNTKLKSIKNKTIISKKLSDDLRRKVNARNKAFESGDKDAKSKANLDIKTSLDATDAWLEKNGQKPLTVQQKKDIFNHGKINPSESEIKSLEAKKSIEKAKADAKKAKKPEAKTEKTVDKLFDKNVTEAEMSALKDELGLKDDAEVKAVVTQAVVTELNNKSTIIEKAKTVLQKVVQKIKNLLIAVFITSQFLINTSFNPVSNAKVATYNNTKIENLDSWNDIYQTQQDVNKTENVNIITSHRFNKEGQYIIIDKKNGKSHLFNNGYLVSTYESGTGKEIGDSQTVTVEKDGITYWDRGNKETGAGIYTVNHKWTDKNGALSFTLRDERGQEVPTVLHETPSDRLKFFGNNNSKDNRMSYGCVNSLPQDMKALAATGFDKGAAVYILPDNPNNRFQVKDGNLVFLSSDVTVNRSLSGKIAPKKVHITATGNLNNNTKEFLHSLADNKAKLMELYPTISNDEYNMLSQLAYGVIGRESSFGTYGGVRGQIGRLADYAKAVIGRNASIGVGQVNYIYINDNVKSAFDINSQKELFTISKNAVGSISVLMDNYVNTLPSSIKSDVNAVKALLPISYNNMTAYKSAVKEYTKSGKIVSNPYSKKVNKYAETVTVLTTDNEIESKSDKDTIPMRNTDTDILLGAALVAALKKKKKGRKLTDEKVKSLVDIFLNKGIVTKKEVENSINSFNKTIWKENPITAEDKAAILTAYSENSTANFNKRANAELSKLRDGLKDNVIYNTSVVMKDAIDRFLKLDITLINKEGSDKYNDIVLNGLIELNKETPDNLVVHNALMIAMNGSVRSDVKVVNKVLKGKTVADLTRDITNFAGSMTQHMDYIADYHKDAAVTLEEVFWTPLKNLEEKQKHVFLQETEPIRALAKKYDFTVKDTTTVQLYGVALRTKTIEANSEERRQEVYKNLDKINEGIIAKETALKRNKKSDLSKGGVALERQVFNELAKKIKNAKDITKVLNDKQQKYFDLLVSRFRHWKYDIQANHEVVRGEKIEMEYHYFPTVSLGRVGETDFEKQDTDLLDNLDSETLGAVKESLVYNQKSDFSKDRTQPKGEYYLNDSEAVVEVFFRKMLADVYMTVEAKRLNKLFKMEEMKQSALTSENLKVVKTKAAQVLSHIAHPYFRVPPLLRFFETLKNRWVIGKLFSYIGALQTQHVATWLSTIVYSPRGVIPAIILTYRTSKLGGNQRYSDKYETMDDMLIALGSSGAINRNVLFETYRDDLDFSLEKAKKGYALFKKNMAKTSGGAFIGLDRSAMRFAFNAALLHNKVDLNNATTHDLTVANKAATTAQAEHDQTFSSTAVRPKTIPARVLTTMVMTFKSFSLHQGIHTLNSARSMGKAWSKGKNNPYANKVFMTTLANTMMYVGVRDYITGKLFQAAIATIRKFAGLPVPEDEEDEKWYSYKSAIGYIVSVVFDHLLSPAPSPMEGIAKWSFNYLNFIPKKNKETGFMELLSGAEITFGKDEKSEIYANPNFYQAVTENSGLVAPAKEVISGVTSLVKDNKQFRAFSEELGFEPNYKNEVDSWYEVVGKMYQLTPVLFGVPVPADISRAFSVWMKQKRDAAKEKKSKKSDGGYR